MTSLLIHNSKIPDISVRKFTKNILLTPSEDERNSDGFDFDVFYHEKLSGIFGGDIAYDVIYISLNLSDSDYLEMNGLRVAHHIRLTNEWNHLFVPIYFVCQETPEIIMRLNLLGSILLSNGIYITNNLAIPEIKYHNRISTEEHERYLNKILIEPPANYQSHHSIANEWALKRYFSMFDNDANDDAYKKLSDSVMKLEYLKALHFKLSEEKITRQRFKQGKNTGTPIITGIENINIGIIDDEINKGWGAFFNYFLKKSNAKSIAYTEFKKGESKVELINRTKKFISDNQIDLFIIDLRLHDDDFIDDNFESLSGVQLIEYIKKINPGIQIVVFTASDKVWNYQNCLELGINNYAIKESPETLNTRDQTKSNICHFTKQLTDAGSKVFLADLYRTIKSLKDKNIFRQQPNNTEFQELVFNTNGLLDQTFNLLLLNHRNEAVINQCLLLCFQILERYCDLSNVGSFGNDKNKLGSGFIWPKDGGVQEQIFTGLQNNKVSTWFELINKKFEFQTENSKETITSYNVFEAMSLISSYNAGIDATTLVKIISVLHFREKIEKADIDRIIKLRYYRSNVAAHLTGNILPDNQYKISHSDIVFLISIFFKMFN